MNVIVAGAGEAGSHASEVLSAAGHSVTVIDVSAEKLAVVDERHDVRTLVGNCAHLGVLKEAEVDKCDLLVAATSADEINLLSAAVAKAAGAKKTIVRVHHTANFRLRRTPYAAALGVDELICPEHMTSLAIARRIRNPGAIALEEFAGGQLLMERCEVSEGAQAIGKSLADLTLPSGTRVATVERSSGALVADAHTTIEVGDNVTLIGESAAFDGARRLFHKGKEKRIHLAIMGETSTAVWLCRALKDRVFSVRLFAENHDRAEELAHKLNHVTVLEADPMDETTFAHEHLEKVDTFVAVTGDDERNILAAAQAKTQGVATAITVVQRSKYLRLVSHVGIDHAFSPRVDAVAAIMHLIDTGPVRSLATFASGMAEVYEIHPSSRVKILGHELRNIQLPPQAMIAAIRRDERVYVPGADDQIAAGDVLLVIGPQGIADALRKLFVSK
jgi:trk system potassium uptake protein TrkA